MAKHARKIREGQKARLVNWQATNPVNGMETHKPGSQNRKRSGYGKRSGR